VHRFQLDVRGNAIYAGCQFATLMLLAKLVSARTGGAVRFGFAVVYPVMMLRTCNFGRYDFGRSSAESISPLPSASLLTRRWALVIIFAITQILDIGGN